MTETHGRVAFAFAYFCALGCWHGFFIFFTGKIIRIRRVDMGITSVNCCTSEINNSNNRDNIKFSRCFSGAVVA